MREMERFDVRRRTGRLDSTSRGTSDSSGMVATQRMSTMSKDLIKTRGTRYSKQKLDLEFRLLLSWTKKNRKFIVNSGASIHMLSKSDSRSEFFFNSEIEKNFCIVRWSTTRNTSSYAYFSETVCQQTWRKNMIYLLIVRKTRVARDPTVQRHKDVLQEESRQSDRQNSQSGNWETLLPEVTKFSMKSLNPRYSKTIQWLFMISPQRFKVIRAINSAHRKTCHVYDGFHFLIQIRKQVLLIIHWN